MSTQELPINSLENLNLIRRVKRMHRSVRAVIDQNNADTPIEMGLNRCAFITLTYRPDAEWEKRQITQVQKCYQEWGRRRDIIISLVWVLELTKKGTPHYHMLLWLPKGITPPMPDKQGWWKHGMSNATWLKKPSRYIAKYFSKSASKDGLYAFPKGARLFGCRNLTGNAMRHLSALMLMQSFKKQWKGVLCGLTREIYTKPNKCAKRCKNKLNKHRANTMNATTCYIGVVIN